MAHSRSERRATSDRITRRAFLGASMVPLVAAAACRRPPFNPREFLVANRSSVSLLPASSYDVDFSDVIGRGLSDLGVNGWTNDPLSKMALNPGLDFADDPLEGQPFCPVG